ncbi:hypothetical protein Hdeb2414_s0025g00669001 [Helianthus debilis subsp. tardiflorus]
MLRMAKPVRTKSKFKQYNAADKIESNISKFQGQNIATDERVETRSPFSGPYTSDLHHNLK